jgi:hypothetical protein
MADRTALGEFLLLDPAARELYLEWETLAAETVAILRLEAGQRPNEGFTFVLFVQYKH